MSVEHGEYPREAREAERWAELGLAHPARLHVRPEALAAHPTSRRVKVTKLDVAPRREHRSSISEPPVLDAGEVAIRLGVCRDTVYELCKRGELRHVRVLNAIRVHPANLAVFIARRRG